jgi:hypothetical protein
VLRLSLPFENEKRAMLTKTEAEDLADLLENLGETFSIRYVARGSPRPFRVVRRSSVAQPNLAAFPRDPLRVSSKPTWLPNFFLFFLP